MSDEEVIECTNSLARMFYAHMGNQVSAEHKFYKAQHPQEKLCWRLACLAQEHLTETDVSNAMMELEDQL